MAEPSTAKEVEESNLEDNDLFEEFAGEAGALLNDTTVPVVEQKHPG
jgi:hypothetical protein